MSILHACDEGWVLCHKDYISDIYEATLNDINVQKFTLRDDLFDIKFPFKSNNVPTPAVIDDSQTSRKKRKRLDNKDSAELEPEAKEIKENFTKILESAKYHSIFNDSSTEANDGNLEARTAAEECSSSTEIMRKLGVIKGGNNSPRPIYKHFENFDVLIPPNCRFISGDVRKTILDIKNSVFDLVVMDPPWWNKYIRRLKKAKVDLSYDMLYNDEIKDIPMAPLISNDAVMAIWCTNCEEHETSIIKEMFKQWSVKYVATWYWMKVTTSGEPICPFSEGKGKQPFERIIIGSNAEDVTALKNTDGKMIVSVPSALHSHKPPINDLLLPFLKDQRCLEVFARYLLPNTTSLGLEPLRWQHTSLYTKR